ncbi:uncharacterized protein LOC131849162 [Achroia grisella]|uniref:uncharacterized protein LOC131849162 n=1 Tax=Achroia grisella TaxID=688607 RepID=UPI0027D34794|nr:uncharacterized protein LOC131849162 [Achroia grisella]
MEDRCRLVSIESSAPTVMECAMNTAAPIPDVPIFGARIRVVFAGACYSTVMTRPGAAEQAQEENIPRARAGSLEFLMQNMTISRPTPAHMGLRDGSLFPGYEVAGIVDAIGLAVEDTNGISEGSRVVVFPTEDVPHGYADFISIEDINTLVPVPDELSLCVACTLPSGGLLAVNAASIANNWLKNMFEGANPKEKATVMIVGTGGLSLWALWVASTYFKQGEYEKNIVLSVATLRRDEFVFCQEWDDEIKVVEWNERLYETQLVESTTKAFDGPLDVIMNFGTTSRALLRCLQCLAPGGVVIITEEVGRRLLPEFASKAEELNVHIEMIPKGSIEQLRELLDAVACGDIVSPPYSLFKADEAIKTVSRLCYSDIVGRAVLEFDDHYA